MNDFNERVLALAAVCQAVELVRQIARDGTCDDFALMVMYKSIVLVDPPTTLAVYGKLDHLKLGYQVLIKQLSDGEAKNPDVTSYLVGILALERKLTKKPVVMNQLATRINDIKRQLQHFDFLDNHIITNIADTYSQLISPLGRRIQVTGSPQILRVPLNQEKIRALLLSAIRAAVLWRQVGGQRRQLFFNRQMLIDVAKSHVSQFNID